MEEKREVADEYTNYMREETWHFGNCDDDLIILVSKEDRLVRRIKWRIQNRRTGNKERADRRVGWKANVKTLWVSWLLWGTIVM